jgi:hypothetical protein
MEVIVAGRGRGPLKALFAPLVAAFDALLGAVSGNIRRCLLVLARCCLPTSLCRVKHGHLVAGGALGGDATRLLKRGPKEVVMSIMSQALREAFGQRAHTTQPSLVVNLRFVVPSLPLPWRGLG